MHVFDHTATHSNQYQAYIYSFKSRYFQYVCGMCALWLCTKRTSRTRYYYTCIPIKLPLSYLRNPKWKSPAAIATISVVKPTIDPNRSQENWCSSCKGTKETKRAGTTVKSNSRTTPLKRFMGQVLNVTS